VAAGTNHTVTLKNDGTVWAWGGNSAGQLGDGTVVSKTTPVQATGPGGVGTLSGVVAVSAGFHYTAALTSDATVWAWGENRAGELGDGTIVSKSAPVQVKGPGGVGTLSSVVAVAAGDYHMVALRSDGGCGRGGAPSKASSATAPPCDPGPRQSRPAA
jgi:alpha-tubulin suppressor-like RCC1 family protein